MPEDQGRQVHPDGIENEGRRVAFWKVFIGWVGISLLMQVRISKKFAISGDSWV